MDIPIKDDIICAKQFEHILTDQNATDSMDDALVNATANECIHRIQRLRMGGRSTPLCALAVLLWRTHERWPRIPFDVEERLAMAFRVSLDPSFVQPEWSVLLIGVLAIRYAKRLDARKEVLKQCHQNLSYLKGCQATLTAVRNAAAMLLKSWPDFPEGLLQSVKQSCLEDWPDTSTVRATPPEELNKIVKKIEEEKLPADLTENERRYYRLYMEREGVWSMLEKVSF